MHDDPRVMDGQSAAVDADEFTEHCQRCGNWNLTWWVDSEQWNLAVPERTPILCPACFNGAWEEATGTQVIWELRLDPNSAALAAPVPTSDTTRPEGQYCPCACCEEAVGLHLADRTINPCHCDTDYENPDEWCDCPFCLLTRLTGVRCPVCPHGWDDHIGYGINGRTITLHECEACLPTPRPEEEP